VCQFVVRCTPSSSEQVHVIGFPFGLLLYIHVHTGGLVKPGFWVNGSDEVP